jgi:hypothetical protein
MVTDAIVVRTKLAITAIRHRSPAGRFKSKADFLRELHGGKSEQLSSKNNPPPPEKKFDK